jgi:hypothetical protein
MITYPEHNARLDDNLVTVGGIASDNVAVGSVEIRIDDGEWFNVWVVEGAKTTGWSVKVVIPSGHHTISVRATDASGNRGDTVSVDIQMFVEPSNDGSEDRLACMSIVAVILLAIVGLYLLTAKREQVQPDEPEHHHHVVEEEDEEEDDEAWRLDDLEVDEELDEEE